MKLYSLSLFFFDYFNTHYLDIKNAGIVAADDSTRGGGNLLQINELNDFFTDIIPIKSCLCAIKATFLFISVRPDFLYEFEKEVRSDCFLSTIKEYKGKFERSMSDTNN